jgi:hypothetical protein
MKITLIQVLALASVAVAAAAAAENVDTRHLRNAPVDKEDTRRAKDTSGSGALQAQEKSEGVEPPEGMMEFVGELDDEDLNAVEDDPPGHRDLVSCKSKCYLHSCKLYYYDYRTLYYTYMDCCQTYSGSILTCH